MDQQTVQPTPPQTSISPVLQNQTTDNYFAKLFSGRINRRNYLIGALILVTINSIIQILLYRFNIQPYSVQLLSHTQQTTPTSESLFAYLVSIPISILVLVISTSLSIRRLHDLNKTGWLTLILFIPIVGAFYGLYVLLAEGTVGQNNYGAQPLPRVNLNQDILKLI